MSRWMEVTPVTEVPEMAVRVVETAIGLAVERTLIPTPGMGISRLDEISRRPF